MPQTLSLHSKQYAMPLPMTLHAHPYSHQVHDGLSQIALHVSCARMPVVVPISGKPLPQVASTHLMLCYDPGFHMARSPWGQCLVAPAWRVSFLTTGSTAWLPQGGANGMMVPN